MSRRYEKMLMGPFYPGGKTLDNGERDANGKTSLQSIDPVELKKIVPESVSDEADAMKKAWDNYFAGIGPMPSA